MTKTADISLKGDVLSLTGDLNFSNVMSVYHKSLPEFSKCQQLIVDFSGLQSSDSAGLALMIEWIKFARQQAKTIKFLHVSKDLELIANAAGMGGLINS